MQACLLRGEGVQLIDDLIGFLYGFFCFVFRIFADNSKSSKLFLLLLLL